MASIGDYKMSQVEQSEADAGRARDDNSYWVQRPEVDRLVAAAVEERDRAWENGLSDLARQWDRSAGINSAFFADALRSLLSLSPERGLVEGRQEPPAVTTSAGVAPAEVEDENLD